MKVKRTLILIKLVLKNQNHIQHSRITLWKESSKIFYHKENDEQKSSDESL